MFANAHKHLRAHFAGMGKICQRWSNAEVQRWLDSCYRPISIEPHGDPKSDTPVPIRLHLRGVRTGHYWAMIMVQERGIDNGGHVVATKQFDVTKPEESVDLMPDAMNWYAVTQRRDRGGSWNVALWPKLTAEEADGLGPLRLGIQFGETNAPTTPISFPWD
jgi:hypothetical protein